MVIDVFSHYVSRSVCAKVGRIRCLPEEKADPAKWEEKFKYPRDSADPEVRIALMDKYGIDAQALSFTAEGLRGFNPQEAAEVCRQANRDNYGCARPIRRGSSMSASSLCSM